MTRPRRLPGRRRPRRAPLALALAAAALAGCAGPDPAPPPAGRPAEPAAPARLAVQVIAAHPFDESSFTQGLELTGDGELLVGTGLVGRSRIYRVADPLGEPREIASRDLDPGLFGEGITRSGERIWQLTWRDGVAIERDAETLAELGRHRLDREGWGICDLGDGRLALSDGTDRLAFRDAADFRPLGEVPVRAAGAPVDQLNELECVPGPGGPRVWANRWRTGELVAVDPRDGRVTVVVDASALRSMLPADAVEPDVLNGIAKVPGGDRWLLAGKRWPVLFEVRFTPAD